MANITEQFLPGSRVAVTQQIPSRVNDWTIRVEGTVIRFEQRKTGSWFAHAKDDRLWLDRLVMKKDDGEIVVWNLDQYTRIEEISKAPAPAEGEAAAPSLDINYAKQHVQPPSAYPPPVR